MEDVGLSLEQGHYRSHSHYQRERFWKRYFNVVLDGYREVKSLAPIIAANPDPAAIRRKLTPDALHFIADIENATKKALKDADLFRSWQALANEEDVESRIVAQIISRCSPFYIARELAPIDYFRTIKKRPERRKTV